MAMLMFVLSVTVCELIAFELPNVLDLNVTLKMNLMKVKDDDDLDENLHTDGPCKSAYLWKNWRFCVQPFDRST